MGIKHLVIVEMQDYTPIQYAVINQLFSCEKTILGDFGQFLNPNHLHGLSDLQQISIQMSKGLEFDEVLIPDVSNDSYCSEYDRNLLYIAATRAMHRLTLLYTGSLSCLLPDALIFSHKE